MDPNQKNRRGIGYFEYYTETEYNELFIEITTDGAVNLGLRAKELQEVKIYEWNILSKLWNASGRRRPVLYQLWDRTGNCCKNSFRKKGMLSVMKQTPPLTAR